MPHARLPSRRLAVGLSGLLVGFAAAAENRKDEPEPEPGVETRVEAPRSGGHFIVYLPTDYTPERRWPVIFCYHGLNGQPTTVPFKQVLKGKGFVIIGMGYLVQGIQRLTLEQHAAYMAREVASFERVAAWVEKRVKVDKSMYFVGGFSKGGWTAGGMGEAIPRTWCGIAILGAARQYFEQPMKNPRAIRGKPIYIGCGTKDGNYPHAEKAASFYRKQGAKVTFEPYEGLGHEMKWETQILPNWLYANGPQRDLNGRLLAAQKAEKAGKLGKAYALYHELSQVSEASELCRSAGEVARRLGERADKSLAEAEKAVGEKRYADARKLLARATSRFEGSPFADRADALIRELQSDPAIQAAMRQAAIDAEADALEARARAADKAQDYAKALQLYRLYASKYAEATRYEDVKARLDTLEADESIQANVLNAQAARECRVWLNLADNYARAGKAAKAREHLGKILAKYPGSDWAAKARERLVALPE